VRVAALYDVHGNLPALEAVLADPRLGTADVIVSGGDVCAGPMPAEVLRLLQQRRVSFVRGNADRELTGWPAQALGEEDQATLRSWPSTVTLEIDGLGSVLFCHATPRSDSEITTAVTPDDAVAETLAGTAADVVVCGHTHVQFDRVVGGTRIVNAGSVGMPYEGRTAAFWALLGPDIELVSTDYDVESAVAAMRATDHPDAHEIVETLLTPHTPAEANEVFEARRLASNYGS
jgi:putative phosphoesterase